MTGVSDRALKVVQEKADRWAADLVQLDSRNTLLNFRVTKTTALDLTTAPEQQVRQLLSGRSIQLRELTTDSEAHRDACTRTRNLARKIRGFSEEQGLDVGRLVYGKVTSEPGKSGVGGGPVTLRAPLLLYQIDIQTKTATESEFTLSVQPEPEVNPVLTQCLEREYGVSLNHAELEEAVSLTDQSVTPDRLAEQLFRTISAAALQQGVNLGFEPLIAVGICNYMKLPMVKDLAESAHLLAQHDLISALIGCSSPETDPLREGEYRPPDPDSIDPNQEFLVLDADSSQQQAISTAIARRHVVIDGPPGTGKSQTIANIIAAGVAEGMRILFVAEKRAAIEAVTDRLEDVGLDTLVLDLHQSTISSRAVAAQLAKSFDIASRIPAVGGEELDHELRTRRQHLNEYVRAMHDRREPWGLSVYHVREKLLTLAANAVCETRFTRLEHFTPDVRVEIKEILEKFVRSNGLRLVRQESPWWHANIQNETQVRDVLAQLDEVTQRTLIDSRTSMHNLVHQAGLPVPQDFYGWERTLALLQRVSGSAEMFGMEIFRAPLAELRVATAPWGERRNLQPRLGWRRRRELLKGLRLNPAGITQKATLKAEVTNVIGELEEWQQLRGVTAGPGTIGDFRAVGVQYQTLKNQLAALTMSVGFDLVQQPLDQVDRHLNALQADHEIVLHLPDLNRWLQRLRSLGLDGLLAEIAQRTTDPKQAVDMFEFALMSSLDREFVLTTAALREFQPDFHDQVLAEFGIADRKHRDLAVRRVLRKAAEGLHSARDRFPDQAILLQKEAKKKRGHRPLRKLVEEASDALLAARPCWAMSPLMVSRALPAQQLFDLVIFDEASQVQPHEAITSIMRGRRLVVAGDDKQLPPTSFFDRLAEDTESEDDGQLKDYESILTTLQPLIPNRRRLRWHYRSQDERLIQFSNTEMYDRELVTFPGARADDPVRLEVVDGRATPGAGSADAEVLRVVELIIEHAETRPEETLGVITLGTAHQQKLDMALRHERGNRPDLDNFFAADLGPTKRFFIKNIETVQGDERDAIILSLGVSKKADGTVNLQGFAVLNREGSERRVNVAVTRAKRRMTVVSSFPPGALPPSDRVTGRELLRRYLEAAAQGGKTDHVGRSRPMELNPFEQAILDRLRAHDIPVHPQWGVSGYRIDFALAHPKEPSRMVLAVEADGDRYHRSGSARDRDRLRQEHLERLGWRFHRVWASAWFADPVGQTERIVDAWHKAVAASDELQDTRVNTPVRSKPVYPSEIRRARQRPTLPFGPPITQYRPGQLVELFLWLLSDGLLLDAEERMRQAREELGFSKRGKRIDDRLGQALEQARGLHEQKGK